ncbi:MAG: glutamate racemase, partial [Gemmatimonadetes bacterium]|nr:glutamate racemase [Gemmatimonadota bacterium]NIQ53605.1 glutamate racemase [Gemmatimonadota bacterium]NIU73767.1 glutamate racemase [Gammaproteobacteria bacterium]NIX43894.1 glutamate racemase [Gemmatimonadota bacterium]NIY08112.1 glutamate racemase [Gemmatimonadota bacterium]
MNRFAADVERDRPIGVFDSGFGGLTVARALHERLPREPLLYFGDTARVPYGSKSPETVRRFAREAAKFLLSRDIKLLVIACNTATAHAEATLREELDIPVVGVIQPGAEAAVSATRTGRIGVVGTTGTIASGAYDLAVRRRLGEDGRVYAQPCPLFVPLVEEGWTDHPVAGAVTAEYLAPLKQVDVDVVILGCTHYPLLEGVLKRELGDGVTLVDSGRETARSVEAILERDGLTRRSDAPPEHAFFVSDSPH